YGLKGAWLRRSLIRPSPRLNGFRQKRQLARARFVRGEMGERRRIVAGEAMVGELGPHRIAALEPHCPIDSVDRQESERIRPDKFPHALEIVGRSEQLVAFGGVDAVVVGMGDRRGGYAEVHFTGGGIT